MLQAHQKSSGLEYFSGEDVSLALKKLADREYEIINVIIGSTDEIVVQCYIDESFSDILSFLYFKPHKKSDKEILEKKRMLGLSD